MLQAFCFGFFTSLQYTSMNTLVYADVTEEQTQQREHHRQHDAADVDQLRVATASLVTAVSFPIGSGRIPRN